MSIKPSIINENTPRFRVIRSIYECFNFPVKNFLRKGENITYCPICEGKLIISKGINDGARFDCHNGCTNDEIYFAINKKIEEKK